VIGNVIHNTFVRVNEEVREAAAAARFVLLRSAVRKFRMTVDGPFLCASHYGKTELLHCVDAVPDPTQG
jgi:serine protease inhibitor